ncbi:hypothetical protein ACFPM0_26695 [Pseudonocardia sulfidoxydans]
MSGNSRYSDYCHSQGISAHHLTVEVLCSTTTASSRPTPAACRARTT